MYFCKVKVIAGILDFLLYTSLFTASCATGLCMATEQLFASAPPTLFSNLHFLIFGSTLLVYNMPRILRKPFASEKNKPLLKNYRFWYFVSFGIGVAMAVPVLLSLPLQLLAGCIILGLLAFMYSLPLLPFKDKKRLREFGWLKITVLAGVWTVATSVLPILYYGSHISNYPFEVLLRFVFIFTLCIIFDIRDIRTDLKSNISTLPLKMGLKNSYLLINIALALFLALSTVQYLRHPAPMRLTAALLTAVITKIVVSYLRKHPSDRAYMGLVDGLMLLYTVLVIPFP